MTTKSPEGRMPSDDEIDEVFNAMPGGFDGFFKSWGYRQFARAILAKYTHPAPTELSRISGEKS